MCEISKLMLLTRCSRVYNRCYVKTVLLTFFFFFLTLQSAQFYKVTTEQYQKAADEVSARFK